MARILTRVSQVTRHSIKQIPDFSPGCIYSKLLDYPFIYRALPLDIHLCLLPLQKVYRVRFGQYLLPIL